MPHDQASTLDCPDVLVDNGAGGMSERDVAEDMIAIVAQFDKNESDRLSGELESVDDEFAHEITEECFDVLYEHCPPYSSVGYIDDWPGVIGVIPHVDNVTRDADELCQVVSDLSEDDGESDYVSVVSDHGNVTLYQRNDGELSEVWSVV